MHLEPQNLRTPPASDTVTDAASSGNGHYSRMPSTVTQGTGVGTDLCMVSGTTVGKTKVSTKQRRLAVAGGTQDDKVVAVFAKVCTNVVRQLK